MEVHYHEKEPSRTTGNLYRTLLVLGFYQAAGRIPRYRIQPKGLSFKWLSRLVLGRLWPRARPCSWLRPFRSDTGWSHSDTRLAPDCRVQRVSTRVPASDTPDPVTHQHLRFLDYDPAGNFQRHPSVVCLCMFDWGKQKRVGGGLALAPAPWLENAARYVRVGYVDSLSTAWYDGCEKSVFTFV